MGRELSARELLAVPRFTPLAQLALSPDGTFIAYSVDQGSFSPGVSNTDDFGDRDESLEETTELWVMELRSGRVERVCCERGSATLPSWSPDGNDLAFYRSKMRHGASLAGATSSTKEGSLGIWNRDTKAVRELLEDSLSIQASLMPPLWVNDNSRVLVFLKPTGQVTPEKQNKNDSSDGRRSTIESNVFTDPHILVRTSHSDAATTSSQTWDNKDDIATRKYYKSDLGILDVVAGDVKRTLENVYPVRYALSRDRTKLAYANYKGTASNSFYQTLDIHLLDIRTSQDRIVLPMDVYSAADNRGAFFSWSPDSRLLSFTDEHAAPEVRDGYAVEFRW